MRRFVLPFAAAIALVAFAGSTAIAAHGRSVAFAPKAHPFGHSYVRWAEDWGNWALGTSVDTNAFVHPDKSRAGPFVREGVVPSRKFRWHGYRELHRADWEGVTTEPSGKLLLRRDQWRHNARRVDQLCA